MLSLGKHLGLCSSPCSQVGEMTQEAVKTRFGYHIILVEARK